MTDFIITGTSISQLRNADYIAVGTDFADGSNTMSALGNEVARAPILNILHGETYLEFRCLIQEEDLPDTSEIAPLDAVREVGIFWNASPSLGSGVLLYRSTEFVKKLSVGNDLYLVIRITPIISASFVTPTRPNTPAAPSLSSPTPNAVKAEWVIPIDNGSDITSYDVRHRETGTSSWTTITGQRGLQYTISGLDAETEYDVRVRARNGIGLSGWSAITSRETIPEYEFDTGALFILNRISNLNYEVWRLNEVTAPGTASKLYDLPYNIYDGLASDSTKLWVLTRFSSNEKELFEITDFSTTSPTITSLGDFFMGGTPRSLVYAENQLVTAVNNSRQVRTITLTLPNDTLAGTLPSSASSPEGLSYDGTQFLSVRDDSIVGFDLSDVAGATELASFTALDVRAIAWDGRAIILADNSLYTISDLTNPVVVDRGEFPSGLGNPQGATWVTF